MHTPPSKIVIGVDGFSSSSYAKALFDRLQELNEQWQEIGVVMTDTAKAAWQSEQPDTAYAAYPFTHYAKAEFTAPFASGSARYEAMIICPCGMGLLGRIATGVSDDLMTRAADVILKERRRLVMVPPASPYNLLHLRNMTALTEAGAIVAPPIISLIGPSDTLSAAVHQTIDRILMLAGLEVE